MICTNSHGGGTWWRLGSQSRRTAGPCFITLLEVTMHTQNLLPPLKNTSLPQWKANIFISCSSLRECQNQNRLLPRLRYSVWIICQVDSQLSTLPVCWCLINKNQQFMSCDYQVLFFFFFPRTLTFHPTGGIYRWLIGHFQCVWLNKLFYRCRSDMKFVRSLPPFSGRRCYLCRDNPR